MNTLKEPPSRCYQPATPSRLIIGIERAAPYFCPPFFESTSVASFACARSSLTLNLREID